MKKPNNIVHICLSSGWGGLEMYPIRTAEEFLSRGYNVYCVCLKGSHIQTRMESLGIPCFTTVSKVKLVTRDIFRLNLWLKNRAVNIIHSHKSGDILVSALLNLLTRRKSFFTEHMGVRKPKKDLYHQWVYRHLRRVFSISHETYQRNIKALPVDIGKITPLWLGTDVPEEASICEEHKQIIKKGLGLPERCMVIGTVGRVCYGKGQMQLFDAFCLLADKYTDLHLLIVGGMDEVDGSDGQFVQELKAEIATSPFSDRVHLTGFRSDTQHMYSIMDIVCLPYHNEAFGLTTIEAMAQAKALVVSNCGALPEIVDDTALKCDPFQIEAIAENIQFLMEHRVEKENFERRAYLRAQKEFSIDKHIQRLIGFYNE